GLSLRGPGSHPPARSPGPRAAGGLRRDHRRKRLRRPGHRPLRGGGGGRAGGRRSPRAGGRGAASGLRRAGRGRVREPGPAGGGRALPGAGGRGRPPDPFRHPGVSRPPGESESGPGGTGVLPRGSRRDPRPGARAHRSAGPRAHGAGRLRAEAAGAASPRGARRGEDDPPGAGAGTGSDGMGGAFRMSRPLVIERVTLVGFGPYRDETAFDFPPGLGVLAAPNEAGKSTLAAAMSAILFGLPAVQDPAAFGLDRKSVV